MDKNNNKYVRVYRDGDSKSDSIISKLSNETHDKLLSEGVKYEIMVHALKLDYNAVLENVIQLTTLNGYLVTNTIIDNINLKEFISSTDNEILSNSKALATILFSEMVRISLQTPRDAKVDTTINPDHRTTLESICFKILKIMK